MLQLLLPPTHGPIGSPAAWVLRQAVDNRRQPWDPQDRSCAGPSPFLLQGSVTPVSYLYLCPEDVLVCMVFRVMCIAFDTHYITLG